MYDSYNIYDEPFSTYSNGFNSDIFDSAGEAFVAAFFAFIATFAVFFLIAGIVSIIILIAKWKIFKKAGKKPWEALIAIHNVIVEMDLGGIETYWYFLQFIPFVGQIAGIAIYFWRCIALAKSFGKGTGFGVLMAFFPFIGYPILAFGNSQYIGPQTNANVFSQNVNSYANNNYSNNVNYNPVPNQAQTNYTNNATQNAQYQPVNNPQPQVAPQQPAEPSKQSVVQNSAEANVTTQASEPIQPVQESLFDAVPSSAQTVQTSTPSPSDIPNTDAEPSVNSDNADM